MGETLLEKSGLRCQAHSLGRGVGVVGRCRTCFPTEGFWIWHLYPRLELGSRGGRQRAGHTARSSLCLSSGEILIREQVFVLEAMEVASGVGEGRARLGGFQLTLHCPTQRGGALPSLAGRAPDLGTALEGQAGLHGI